MYLRPGRQRNIRKERAKFTVPGRHKSKAIEQHKSQQKHARKRSWRHVFTKREIKSDLLGLARTLHQHVAKSEYKFASRHSPSASLLIMPHAHGGRSDFRNFQKFSLIFISPFWLVSPLWKVMSLRHSDESAVLVPGTHL